MSFGREECPKKIFGRESSILAIVEELILEYQSEIESLKKQAAEITSAGEGSFLALSVCPLMLNKIESRLGRPIGDYNY